MSHQKPPLPTITRDRSRALRQASNEIERRFWFHLRGGRLSGYKFRRQHPIPPYVADFFCHAARLVVEIDGSQHNLEDDRIRTDFLRRQGYEVVRFWDNEVTERLEDVLEHLLRILDHRTLTPGLSPGGRGEK